MEIKVCASGCFQGRSTTENESFQRRGRDIKTERQEGDQKKIIQLESGKLDASKEEIFCQEREGGEYERGESKRLRGQGRWMDGGRKRES